MKAIAVANLGFINRALASRAFEFFRLVDEFGSRDRDSQSGLSVKLRHDFAQKLRPLRKVPIYKLVETMRNQLSHHYSLGDFERFSEVSGYGKASMWLGDMEGNSIYSLGEEVTNIGLFSDVGDAEVSIGEWIDWSRDAAQSISSVNAAIAIAIAEEFVPEISMKPHIASVPATLFADVNNSQIPMLWYPFNGMDR